MLSDLKCTQRICEKFCERIRGAVGLDLSISQFMGALILAAGFCLRGRLLLYSWRDQLGAFLVIKMI